MDRADLDNHIAKPKTEPPVGVMDREDDAILFAEVKLETMPPSDSIIKIEMDFSDLPIEFEPRTCIEGDFKNVGKVPNVKQENHASSYKVGSAVKSEPGSESGDEVEDGKKPSTIIDISHLDIKAECWKYSKNTDQLTGGISAVQGCVLIKSAEPSTSPRKPGLVTQIEEKSFSCFRCTYTCTKEGNLRSHVLTHAGKKTFSCSHCAYISNRKENLSRHMFTHTGEKPFSCSYCTYECNRKGHLIIHMLVHTGERPYSCSHCAYTCNKRGNLRSHMLTHTSKKPFSCSHCTYTCNRKENLRRHMLTHSGEKPFACSYCTYECNRKSHLTRHLLVHSGGRLLSSSHSTHTCSKT